MESEFSISLLLVIATGLISYQAFNNPMMRGRLLFVPDLIRRIGQYDRFLTHGFIHADWLHLFFNMYVLYEFGRVIEMLYKAYFGEVAGIFLFLLLYVGGIVVASIPSFFKHRYNPMYGALGASGAVSGIVFALIFFEPWSMIYLFGILPLPIVLGGVLYLWYSDYMGKHGNDNVGHDAHFYGAIFGFTFTIVAAALVQPNLIQIFIQKLIHPTIF